jgi:hypothetical protein
MPEVKNVLVWCLKWRMYLCDACKYILHFRHHTSTFFTSGITQVHSSLQASHKYILHFRHHTSAYLIPEVKYALVWCLKWSMHLCDAWSEECTCVMPKVKYVLVWCLKWSMHLCDAWSEVCTCDKCILHFRHHTSAYFTSGITQVHTSLQASHKYILHNVLVWCLKWSMYLCDAWSEVCTCVMPEVKHGLVWCQKWSMHLCDVWSEVCTCVMWCLCELLGNSTT